MITITFCWPVARTRCWPVWLAVWFVAGPVARAAEPKAILFLQQASPEREAMAKFLAGFRDGLAKQWPAPVTLHMEDIAAGYGDTAQLEVWLQQKYQGRRIDLIAAFEGPGTRLGVRFRQLLRPGVPVVLTGISAARYRELAGPTNLTGVTIEQDVMGLLEAARRLCPETRRVAFIAGGLKPTEAERKLWRQDAEQFAAAYGLEFVDLSGRSLPVLLEQVSGLPPPSLIVRRDTILGGMVRPADRARTMRQLSQAASGPLLTIADAYADDGATGTGTVDYERLGAEFAAQVVAVFKAGEASAVPVRKSAAFATSFDWRQLQRWGLDEKLVPPGSEVRFRTPGLWEDHRGTMIGVTVAVTAQAFLIAALLVQRRRRRVAEEALGVQRAQLAHTLRLATMSQMAASLAHELNQPLTAMVNNAGAARRMMVKGTADPAQLREILLDISADGHRAGEVIRGIRGLARREEGARMAVNWNDIVAVVRRMVAAEAVARDCVVIEELAPALPVVEANAVQMQQVLLNLLMNAFDAVDAPGTTARRIIIRTEAEGESAVRVSVRDFGPGLPPEGPEKLFEQFYTTKANGLGMGLVIVRSIVEAHGGSLGAANAEGGGARFHFRLPAVHTAGK